MNILSTILNHRSVRSYKNTPIAKEILDDILIAASRGSNTGNMQVYSIVVTQDQILKNQLAPAHFNQKMVMEAPVVMTFCADFNRFNLWCELRDAMPGYNNMQAFTWAAIDAIIAAQNAVIAAESYNLGICYLGTTTYNAAQIIDILKLPIGVVPITTIVMGYPSDLPLLTDRLPVEAIVHKEIYQNYSPESINDFYAEKESMPSTLKLIEENNTQNLAQIFTEKRYKKEDNIYFSEKWIQVLKKQGFLNHD